ncbi:MAG: choice-of-anchor K domain-containing protein [Myxococcales bacterium]|nr:choice-of-anchor K domain-containing protein [Myxococcales bacterium]
MTTVTTSGTWTSINPQPPNTVGLGTQHAGWGTPAPQLRYGKASSYQFDGVSGVQANLDGTEFKLGTFTHHNFPLNPTFNVLKFGVNLKVTVTFDQGLTKDFNYLFNHWETPGSNQPDEVTFPNAQSKETVTLGGKEYLLTITGFKQNGQLVSKFVSPEAQSNAADIFAKLEAVNKVEPPPAPEKKITPPPTIEEECKVKAVVSTTSLFAVALERLNRRSVVQLLEQIIAEVNKHCEQQPGTNISITEVLQQIEMLNAKLLIIQKAAKELDDKELGQINLLLQQLIQNIDLSKAIQNVEIHVDGRSFNVQSLLQVISTVDQVVNIQIQYGAGDLGDIVGAIFILTDKTQIVFNVRTINLLGPDRITYLFETPNWRGLPAQFSLVFSRRTSSYKLCNRTVSFETFDAIEQTNIVFDLCTQITKGTVPPPPVGGCVPPPPVESKSEFIPPPPWDETPPAKGSSATKAGKSSKKE